MGERRSVYRVLVGKPEGKNRLGDPGEDGKIILRWVIRNWIQMAQDRDIWQALVNAVMNFLVP